MRFRHFILHVAGLGAALGVSIDAVLQITQAGGLCQTQSCQAVGDYVRFGETFLIIGGAVFFWSLWLLFFLATRLNRPFIWHLATLALFGALAFDGGLLGYQFMGLQMQCWLCIGVGVALAVNLFSLAWVRQAWMIACIGLVVWMGGFAANSTLHIIPQAPQLDQAAFVAQETASQEARIQGYLFFSLHCGHCMEIVVNLAMHGTGKVDWHLCSLDRSFQDMRKLAWIKKQVDQGADPFVQVLKAKQMSNLPMSQVPQDVQEAVHRAKDFFAHRNYRGVPKLFVDMGQGQEMVLTGSSGIARFLVQQGVVSRWMEPKDLRSQY